MVLSSLCYVVLMRVHDPDSLGLSFVFSNINIDSPKPFK